MKKAIRIEHEDGNGMFTKVFYRKENIFEEIDISGLFK